MKITNEMLNGISPTEAERMNKEILNQHLEKLSGWSLVEGNKIRRTFEFKDFKQTMDFVNQIADIAEEQGHHPDICIHYNQAEIMLWTHKIKGLHKNDFAMAARIDKIIGR